MGATQTATARIHGGLMALAEGLSGGDLILPDTWIFRDSEAFSRIRARLTFVGISSDWLFTADAVRRFAEEIRGAGAHAEYREMISDHGHDAFLAEQVELVRLLQ